MRWPRSWSAFFVQRRLDIGCLYEVLKTYFGQPVEMIHLLIETKETRDADSTIHLRMLKEIFLQSQVKISFWGKISIQCEFTCNRPESLSSTDLLISSLKHHRIIKQFNRTYLIFVRAFMNSKPHKNCLTHFFIVRRIIRPHVGLK